MANIKFNRWLVVVGALMIQISLGAIYIYSIFKPALHGRFPGWSATDISLPAQIILVFESLGMIVSGKLQGRIGLKKAAVLGGFLLLSGIFIASRADSLAQFVLGFGIIAGSGVGIAYACPLAACIKWFPDKRGLVTGVAVAGFGAGGFIFTPLADYLIASFGIMAALFYLGIIYFLAIIIGAQFLTSPPVGYLPAGWRPPMHQARLASIVKTDYSPKEMVQTRQFWILWFTYLIACASGLMIIMNIINIWQSNAILELIRTRNLIPSPLFDMIMSAGAAAIMIVSISNSLGRIIWGKISDNFGREKAISLAFFICGVSLIVLNYSTVFPQFLAAISIIGLCFGGFLALYPVIAADYFGDKNISSNYGLMYSAYGIGGLLGPWLAPGFMADIQTVYYESADKYGPALIKSIEVGSYLVPFIIAGISCFVAALLILKLKPLQ